MTGSRVGSLAGISKPMRKPFAEVSETNKRIAESIPMYPDSVSIAWLRSAFGLSHFALTQRIVVLQEKYLIAEDGGRLTRLQK